MKLIIVEDDKMLLQNLKFFLDAEREIHVAGAYSNAEDALSDLEETKPELILLDLELPGMHGIDFIKRVKEKMPDVEILVHTVFEDKNTIFSALKAGATGYVLKGASPRELMEAIINQYEGGVPMSPRIARAVIKEFQGMDDKEEFLLTPRETEILKGVEQGYTYNEIADKCNISRNTVHTYIKKIYKKLHAKNRHDAILRARKKGLL